MVLKTLTKLLCNDLLTLAFDFFAEPNLIYLNHAMCKSICLVYCIIKRGFFLSFQF